MLIMSMSCDDEDVDMDMDAENAEFENSADADDWGDVNAIEFTETTSTAKKFSEIKPKEKHDCWICPTCNFINSKHTSFVQRSGVCGRPGCHENFPVEQTQYHRMLYEDDENSADMKRPLVSKDVLSPDKMLMIYQDSFIAEQSFPQLSKPVSQQLTKGVSSCNTLTKVITPQFHGYNRCRRCGKPTQERFKECTKHAKEQKQNKIDCKEEYIVRDYPKEQIPDETLFPIFDAPQKVEMSDTNDFSVCLRYKIDFFLHEEFRKKFEVVPLGRRAIALNSDTGKFLCLF